MEPSRAPSAWLRARKHPRETACRVMAICKQVSGCEFLTSSPSSLTTEKDIHIRLQLGRESRRASGLAVLAPIPAPSLLVLPQDAATGKAGPLHQLQRSCAEGLPSALPSEPQTGQGISLPSEVTHRPACWRKLGRSFQCCLQLHVLTEPGPHDPGGRLLPFRTLRPLWPRPRPGPASQ